MFVEQLIEFLKCWNETRSLRRIALLAFLLAAFPLFMSGLVLWGYSTSINTLGGRHIQLVEARLDSIDGTEEPSEYANELYVPLNRILQLGQSNERVTFIVGRQLLRQRRIAEAVRKLREIAPVGERGYPPAHLLLAEIDRQSLDSVFNDLAVADSSLSTMPTLFTQQYVGLLLKKGMQSEALAVLRLRAEQNPELNLMLAKVAFQTGDRNELRAAASGYRELLDTVYEGKEHDENYFVGQITLADLLGDTEQVSQLVTDGLASVPESHKLRQYRSTLLLAEALSPQDQEASEAEQQARSLAKLREAVEADPTNPAVLNVIAKAMANGTALPREMIKVLENSLKAGTTPANALFEISKSQLKNVTAESAEYAIANLQAIDKQGAAGPEVFNNLAFALLAVEPPRINDALMLLSRALQYQNLPDSALASIYDTQGQARAMAGDELGAIESYENAIQLAGGKLNSRESLAKLYAKQGMTDLAVAQRDRIEELKQGTARN